MRTPCIRALAGALTMLALSGAALAGSAPPVDDAKLEAYLDARLAAEEVAALWRWRLSEAETLKEASVLTNAARRDVMATVARTPGITADEYLGIALSLHLDRDLKDRLRRVITLRTERLYAEGRFDEADRLRRGVLTP